MTTALDTGRARAWAWVEHLRGGGTTPWAAWDLRFRRPASRFLPGRPAARAAAPAQPRRPPVGRPGRAGADRLRPRPRPTRPRAGRRRRLARFGPPAVDPATLPDDELLRVATGLLALDLVAGAPRHPRSARRAGWRTRYQLAGDPWLAAAHTRALVAYGRPPGGGGRAVHVLGADLPTMLAHTWTAGALGAGVPPWPDFLARVRARRRLPRRIALADVVARFEARPHTGRVEVVLDPAALPRLVGVRRLDPVADLPGPATELARQVGVALSLHVLPQRQAELLDSVLRPRLARVAGPLPDVPPEHRDWVEDAAFALRQRLLRARYPVVGDPDGVLPPWLGSPGTRGSRRISANATAQIAQGKARDPRARPGDRAADGGRPMSRKVLLHVGTPKTGTSYLQDVLFRNREVLEQAGIAYPATRHDSHFLAALDLMQLPWGGLQAEAIGAWDAPGRAGARARRHRDRQPRDPGDGQPGADRARAGEPRPRRGHRGAPGAERARPGPPDPGGVAGERQAPRPAQLRGVPRPDPRPRAREPDRRVVLGRAGGPRHPRPLGPGPRPGARARGDGAAAGRRAGAAVEAVQPGLRPRRHRPRPRGRAAEPVPRRAGDHAAAPDQPQGQRRAAAGRLPAPGPRAARPPDPVAPHALAAAGAAAGPARLGAGGVERRGSRRSSAAGTTSSATSATSWVPRRSRSTPTRTGPASARSPRPAWTRSPRCCSTTRGCATRSSGCTRSCADVRGALERALRDAVVPAASRCLPAARAQPGRVRCCWAPTAARAAGARGRRSGRPSTWRRRRRRGR